MKLKLYAYKLHIWKFTTGPTSNTLLQGLIQVTTPQFCADKFKAFTNGKICEATPPPPQIIYELIAPILR